MLQQRIYTLYRWKRDIERNKPISQSYEVHAIMNSKLQANTISSINR